MGVGQELLLALGLSERSSVVAQRQLLATALRNGIGQVSVAGTHAALARQSIIVREIGGRRLTTTPEVLAEERGMLEFASRARGACSSMNGQWKLRRDFLNDD